MVHCKLRLMNGNCTVEGGSRREGERERRINSQECNGGEFVEGEERKEGGRGEGCGKEMG